MFICSLNIMGRKIWYSLKRYFVKCTFGDGFFCYCTSSNVFACSTESKNFTVVAMRLSVLVPSKIFHVFCILFHCIKVL